MSDTPAWIRGRLRPEPATSRFVYNTFFKRGSTYMATVMVVAVFGGLAYDNVMNSIWDANNSGVRHPPAAAPAAPPHAAPPSPRRELSRRRRARRDNGRTPRTSSSSRTERGARLAPP